MIEELNRKRNDLLATKPLIERLCYQYIRNIAIPKMDNLTEQLSLEESTALNGYSGNRVGQSELETLIKRRSVKGIGIDSNIFNFLGIYLSAPDILQEKLSEKFLKSNLKCQYLIYKVNRQFEKLLINSLVGQSDGIYVYMMKYILLNEPLPDYAKFCDIFSDSFDMVDLIISEDFAEKYYRNDTTITNLAPYVAVKQILNEFSNTIKKVTHRRKNHSPYIVHDEYDLQDIVYVMLKGLFPGLIAEEVTPKVGCKYNLIDLILREEGLFIELKMIKENDKDEKEFIDQLKVDIESYYTYPNIKKLLFFVYDPHNKTKDDNSFTDLIGKRQIRGVEFDVEVILSH